MHRLNAEGWRGEREREKRDGKVNGQWGKVGE